MTNYGIPLNDGEPQPLPLRERSWPTSEIPLRPHPFVLQTWIRETETWELTEAVTQIRLSEQVGELGEQLTFRVRDVFDPELGKWTRDLMPLAGLINLYIDWGTGWQVRYTGRIWEWTQEPEQYVDVTVWDPFVGLRSEDNRAWQALTVARDGIIDILKSAGTIPLSPDITAGEGHAPVTRVGPLIYRGDSLRDMVGGFLKAVYRERGGEWWLRYDAVGGASFGFPGSNRLMPTFTDITSTKSRPETQSLDGFVSEVKIVATITGDESQPYDLPVLATVKGLQGMGTFRKVIDAGSNGQFATQLQAEAGAKLILNDSGRPKRTRSVTTVDLPFLRRWDRITIDHVGTLNGTYVIDAIEHDLLAGTARMELRDQVRPLLFPEVLKVPSVRSERHSRPEDANQDGSYDIGDTIRAVIQYAQLTAGKAFWRNFAVAMLSIAGIESEWNPSAQGDYVGGTPTSWGIYQLHENGGQADAFIARYGRGNLLNPYAQAEYKAPTIWADYLFLGGEGQMLANPTFFITQLELRTERPAYPPTAERVNTWYQKSLDEVANAEWVDPSDVAASGFWWPFPGAEGVAWVQSGYGFNDWSSQSKNYHPGIDIATITSRLDVGAAGDGDVIYAAWDGGYGNKVTLRHPSTGGVEYTTVYGHLAEFRVAVGQRVRAKDTIGIMGSTGNSSGPHCHFETREDGVPQNPRDLVTNKCWSLATKVAC